MARKKKNLELGLNAAELDWIERVKNKYTSQSAFGAYHEDLTLSDQRYPNFFNGALIESTEDATDQYVIVAAHTVACNDHTHNLFFLKKIGLSALGKIKRLRSYEKRKLSDRQFQELFFNDTEEFDYRKEIRETNTRIQRIKRNNRPWLVKFKLESESEAWLKAHEGKQVDIFVLKLEEENAHKFTLNISVSPHGYIGASAIGVRECIPVSVDLASRPEKQCNHDDYRSGWSIRTQMYSNNFLRFIKEHDVYTRLPSLAK